MHSLAKSSLQSTIDAANDSSTRKTQQSSANREFKKRCEDYFETMIDPVDQDFAKNP